MSRNQDLNHAPDLTAQIDRLVSNELSEVDRRALLVRLEATPDGWRRCALAFLEDQAWRSALTTLTPGVAVSPAAPAFSLPQRPTFARRVVQLALAAGFMAITLGSGFWAGIALSSRSGSEPIVASQPLPPPQPTEILPEATQETAEADPGQPQGWVGLVQQQGDGAALVRAVPYLAPTPANAAWVKNQPASIPDYVRAQLERQGYQVEETHRLVDMNLQDGRRVAIPVDEVAVGYVGYFSL